MFRGAGRNKPGRLRGKRSNPDFPNLRIQGRLLRGFTLRNNNEKTLVWHWQALKMNAANVKLLI